MEKIEHIYIHIPFCDSKCPYCDFYSLSSNDDTLKNNYVKKIFEEIDQYENIISKEIKSIYIGGGTPNSLSMESLTVLFKGLNQQFKFVQNIEFTVEVNPGSVTEEKLKLFKDSGVNRLSIGSQSFLVKELQILGRTHTPEDIYRTLNAARKLEYENINLDLIFSIPGQTINSLIYSLNKLIELSPEHISAYMLTYYNGTKFYNSLKNNSLKKIEDDIESEYYDIVKDLLGSHKFEHYELSNFSKKGRGSKHNLNTWNFGNYIGVGASAHSFYENNRWYNDNNVEQYISKELLKYPNKSTLNPIDKKNEFLMLGLRKFEGASIENYYDIFGSSIVSDFEHKIKRYLENNFLVLDKKKLYINPDRINIYNTIVSDILLD